MELLPAEPPATAREILLVRDWALTVRVWALTRAPAPITASVVVLYTAAEPDPPMPLALPVSLGRVFDVAELTIDWKVILGKTPARFTVSTLVIAVTLTSCCAVGAAF